MWLLANNFFICILYHCHVLQHIQDVDGLLNWDKTKIMIIHNKKNIVIPASFSFRSFEIEVVPEFKLLGVIIDNKLNFTSHVNNLKATINKKLNSIKQLFFPSKPVKIQFFKTFILPHFDYCLSLTIYFSKPAIQSLSNSYYISLFKLIHFKAQVFTDFNIG
ncbi:RNA-directed DNA polymerase from mobile element jockey-like [Brachionus plicatilis]|uniref:RNA-directed DNA polymerase from mobile element jockey-like n=1 Tax=Brachionus plicatilis TaxID=10195 RepID=A0A3M7Q0T4_BRAPC|nr:RNA-directed DNA polymerase from mobile element jockey-like [Brachionus plicatilis]